MVRKALHGIGERTSVHFTSPFSHKFWKVFSNTRNRNTDSAGIVFGGADRAQLKLYTLQWRHNEPDRVSNHQPHDCLLNSLFRCRPKIISKLRSPAFVRGTVTGEFPAQRASNAENVSIWWRHHGKNSAKRCTMPMQSEHHLKPETFYRFRLPMC